LQELPEKLDYEVLLVGQVHLVHLVQEVKLVIGEHKVRLEKEDSRVKGENLASQEHQEKGKIKYIYDIYFDQWHITYSFSCSISNG